MKEMERHYAQVFNKDLTGNLDIELNKLHYS